MAVQFHSVVLATPGTPQQISKTLSPSGPTITMGGVTSALGGATQAFKQIIIQASSANTAAKSIFIGGPAMNRTTFAGIGTQLLPGISVSLGQAGDTTILDDIWIDSDSTNAATEKVFLTLVG
ncbi:hypothetical protein BH10ACI4_BH10ACI4_25080 [soil metagenome]